MKTKRIIWEDLGVRVDFSAFAPEGGLEEFQVILHVEPRGELFSGQIQRIYAAEDRLMEQPELAGAHAIVKRYFLSDAANQRPLMKEEPDCAYSFIQQQPLDGSKVGVWLYLQKGSEVKNENGMVVSSHNGYRHLWKMGMHEHKGDSAWQTESLLIDYEEALQSFGASLEKNCVRTWFFVRDVDTQYGGMVRARRENFEEQGLTSETHFIASTGIGGVPADTRALIQLGTYAITGLEPGQQRYLYARTHLNPTYEYGVTFERGTAIDYGDRRHVYISGTASINNKGEVVHVGDVAKQTERMWENVEALLAEADATFDDVMHFVVYLRDVADYDLVRRKFAERFPDMPCIITLAPVCRPTWLIEMECMAVKPLKNEKFRNF
jgi:enamine deaminase RidA (YjgF/YER057c/UK114 family)